VRRFDDLGQYFSFREQGRRSMVDNGNNPREQNLITVPQPAVEAPILEEGPREPDTVAEIMAPMQVCLLIC
jgi:hypothetical protein